MHLNKVFTLFSFYDCSIRGVGPWLIRQMKEFFEDSNQDLAPTEGNLAGDGVNSCNGRLRTL
jgi:hypothetical protein